MRPPHDIDHRIAALAGRQHGVVAHRQLSELGLSDRAISRRLAAGRLIPIHHGVYAVGHAALSQHGRWLAAVLACGPTAVLSHGSAAALWELTSYQPSKIHVIVQTYAGLTAPRGVRLHRYRSLVPQDVARRRAIPVTSVARTLLDLAPVLPRRKLERAIGQADVFGLLDIRDAERLIAAHPRRPGVKAFAASLTRHRPELALSRSDFEDRLVELCERHDLPAPRKNVLLADLEVDLHWPGTDVVAEADGFAFHRTRAAFENDRRRDAVLSLAGYRVHRFTDRQVAGQPELVAAVLRRSLSGWRGRAGSVTPP
ncbi:MAG TPA: type IV toxin-antitoxin system AbiEi family antitoxin domain-containing protein [Capillimicrobium sp.]|nr:type IV toxin-antitoxin system AbiEi family antitoxin domain-containing protein [Capillimicrobium sp.]